MKYLKVFFLFSLFTNNCFARKAVVTIAAVGDILLHTELQKKAAEENDFSYLWKDLKEFLDITDITYANLEGPSAFNEPRSGSGAKSLEVASSIWNESCYKKEFYHRNVENNIGFNYSSYPCFNYHPDLVTDLKFSGFNLLSTANNHSLDRRSRGLDKTINALTNQEMDFVGTRKKDDPSTNNWILRNQINGIKLSWISCTYGTNGITDVHNQVLNCFDSAGNEYITATIRQEVQSGRTVIILPHWGAEYSPNIELNVNISANTRQKEFAYKWIGLGVKLIIGNHSHAFKKFERIMHHAGNEGVVLYSLGNFVSNQGNPAQRATGIAFLKIEKDLQSNQVQIIGPKLIPAYMGNRYFKGENISLIPLDKEDIQIPEYKYLKSAFGEENFIFKIEELNKFLFPREIKAISPLPVKTRESGPLKSSTN
jgi:poly-gamma-glutamate synthesis protein (capsule biosynthesis protein)